MPDGLAFLAQLRLQVLPICEVSKTDYLKDAYKFTSGSPSSALASQGVCGHSLRNARDHYAFAGRWP